MFGRGGSSSHTPPCAKWQALNRHIQSHNLALALEYLVEWQCKVARAVRCVAVVTAAGVRRCRCWLLQTLQVWRKMTMQSMGMQDKARLLQLLQHNKDKAAVFGLWACAIHVATMSRRDLRIHNMLTRRRTKSESTMLNRWKNEFAAKRVMSRVTSWMGSQRRSRSSRMCVSKCFEVWSYAATCSRSKTIGSRVLWQRRNSRLLVCVWECLVAYLQQQQQQRTTGMGLAFDRWLSRALMLKNCTAFFLRLCAWQVYV